tara:strand:- start:800 stop:1714 length:915 start_codon:yes stop_codon:yes gene_type:complete
VDINNYENPFASSEREIGQMDVEIEEEELLRETIRRLFLEVYELDDEQIGRKEKLMRDAGSWFGSKLARASGLQGSHEQLRDREGLKQYQEMLKDDRGKGKKMIQAFMKGDVTVLHSFDFVAATSRADLGGTDSTGLASDWIKKYGKRGKDSLSVVAFFEPVTSSIATRNSLNNNANFVATARGVILKGYPTYVGEHDSFTQTLGAIDDKMKKHWKNSGIPKRPDTEMDDYGAFIGITNLRRLRRVGYSNETILDNWTVVGTYINEEESLNPADIQAYVDDSLAIGLPCNVYDQDGGLVKRHEP